MPAKIAVVEDDRDLSNLLRYVLEQAGFEFVGTHDGVGAQDFCQREQPDLILLDVMLPGTDGFSIFAAICAQTPASGRRRCCS